MTKDDEPTPEEHFAYLVRSSRVQQGLTQEGLARHVREETGVAIDQSGIARIEAGKRAARFNEVVALSRALGIDGQVAQLVPPRPEGDMDEAARKTIEQALTGVIEGRRRSYEILDHLDTQRAETLDELATMARMESRLRFMLETGLQPPEDPDLITEMTHRMHQHLNAAERLSKKIESEARSDG